MSSWVAEQLSSTCKLPVDCAAVGWPEQLVQLRRGCHAHAGPAGAAECTSPVGSDASDTAAESSVIAACSGSSTCRLCPCPPSCSPSLPLPSSGRRVPREGERRPLWRQHQHAPHWPEQGARAGQVLRQGELRLSCGWRAIVAAGSRADGCTVHWLGVCARKLASCGLGVCNEHGLRCARPHSPPLAAADPRRVLSWLLGSAAWQRRPEGCLAMAL